jgi:hypothetical protein
LPLRPQEWLLNNANEFSKVWCVLHLRTLGKFSLEHVPPRAVFKEHRVFEAEIIKLFDGRCSFPRADPVFKRRILI